MKKILAFIMTVFLSLGLFAGCGGTGEGDLDLGILGPNDPVPEGGTALSISVYQAGNGIEYLRQIAGAYHAENPDVYFYLEGNISLDGQLEGRIKAGTNVSDIYSTTQVSIINQLIRDGLVEDLTSLYEEEIEPGVTLNSLVPETMNDYVTLGTDKKYIVPLFTNLGGIVYNVNMFEQYGWQIPETMEDFYDLLTEITTDTNGEVSPLTFCGSLGGYFDMLFNIWYAQAAGVEGINEYLAMESAEVYRTESRTLVYQTMVDLVSDKSRFPTNVMSLDHMGAQTSFLNGEAAMLVGASWVETEMSEYLSDPIYDDFEMALMNLPKIGASEAADGTLLDCNGDPVKDYAVIQSTGLFIPHNAPNKELAKDFLLFFNRQSSIEMFTRYSGALRPFDYSNISTANFSSFQKSVVDIYNTTEPIVFFSLAPLALTGQAGMHPNNDAFFRDIWNGSTAAEVVQKEYSYVSNLDFGA